MRFSKPLYSCNSSNFSSLNPPFLFKSDLNRLKKSPKTRIVEARSLLEMSKEAPEGTMGLPPSPWAAFFGQNLKTISKVLFLSFFLSPFLLFDFFCLYSFSFFLLKFSSQVLKAAGAAVINLDTISNLISDHLVKTLASSNFLFLFCFVLFCFAKT